MTAPAVAAPAVSVVVVNYRGWQDTLACVETLVRQDYPALRIFVVDNASPDDSVVRLRDGLPPGVELLVSPRNGGFSSGNNFAIRPALAAGAEFIWLLNNDTLAPPDTLRKLIASAQAADPGARRPITGTVLTRMEPPHAVSAWGGGSLSLLTGYNTHRRSAFTPAPGSFLTFASVLIPAEVFRTIGLLDEGFFMYSEDADFCLRAQAAGFPLAVAAATAVQHKEGGSQQPGQSVFMTQTVTASGLRLLGRHGRPARLAQFLFVASRVAKRLLRGDFAGVRAVLAGARPGNWRVTAPVFVPPGTLDES